MILRIRGIILLFGFTLFLTHNYSPKIIGQYDFIRTYLLVLGSLCMLGTDQSILYFAGILNSEKRTVRLRQIYLKSILMFLISSLIAILILLILGKKDPVLNYEENLEQIEGTNVKLISFNDGHMSHLENQAELEKVMVGFLKS